MDSTAISLCMENKLPIVVFDLNRPGISGGSSCGEPVGSIVSADWRTDRRPGQGAAIMDAVIKDLEIADAGGRGSRSSREFAGVRTGRASTRCSTASASRLLRHHDAHQPGGHGVRARRAHPHHPAVGGRRRSRRSRRPSRSPTSGSRRATTASCIRLTMPTLTEERRKQLAKSVGKFAEEAPRGDPQRAPRGQRQAQGARQGQEGLRGRGAARPRQIQKTTDRFIAKVDELAEEEGAGDPRHLSRADGNTALGPFSWNVWDRLT